MKTISYFKRLLSLELDYPDKSSGKAIPNILIKKGDHFFEIVMYLSFLISVVFSALNVIFWDTTELLITLLPVPFIVISFILFKKKYHFVAKTVFVSQLLLTIFLLVMHNGEKTGVIIFFIPVFIAAMMIFQGNQRKAGYILVGIAFLILLAIFENHFRFGFRELTPQQVRREFIINMVGASLVTFMEIVMIIEISNRIQFQLMDKSKRMQHQNEELVKANTELDNFVYSVSHDLRSPLLSVKGLLALVFETGKLEPETERYLKMADKSIARLDHTIQEILDYSRNARVEVITDPVNVSSIVHQIYADLQYAVPPGFRFIADFNETTIIKADKARLETVLRNVIGNSVKYRRPDIPDGYVSVSLDFLDHKIRIIVSDNGEGIDPIDLPRVFEMFYRGTSTSLGSGLGLYICKEVLAKMMGTISIASTLHKGTVVTIILPEAD